MNPAREKRSLVPLVCGGILVLLFSALLIPDRIVNREERDAAFRELCGKRLADLYRVCAAYAEKYGEFPYAPLGTEGTPALLVRTGFLKENSELVRCPGVLDLRKQERGYHFLPGVSLSDGEKVPCILERITNHERVIHVVFCDGTVRVIPHEFTSYTELIQAFPEVPPSRRDGFEQHLKRLDIP